MMVTGDVLGWGSGESSQRRGHSDYEKLLGKGILAVGTGSAKLPKKGHVRKLYYHTPMRRGTALPSALGGGEGSHSGPPWAVKRLQ